MLRALQQETCYYQGLEGGVLNNVCTPWHDLLKLRCCVFRYGGGP